MFATMEITHTIDAVDAILIMTIWKYTPFNVYFDVNEALFLWFANYASK